MGGTKISDDGPARIEWSDLKVFYYVAETGSITAAAAALRLAQPTVSQRVKALEMRLGAQLLVRSPTGVKLTQMGETVRERVLSMERTAVGIERIAEEHDARDEGRVRIATPDGVSPFWLAPRVPDFQRLNPGIALTLDAGLWPNEPMRNEIDISLQYEQSQVGDNVVRSIATIHYAAFVSPGYVDLYGMPKGVADIPNHRAVHHAAQTRQTETYDPRVNAVRTLWGAELETNSSATVIHAVRAGAGVGFLPTAVASFAPELLVVGEEPMAALKLWLVYHRDVARIARIRRVIEWLDDVFSPKSQPWFRDNFVHPRDFASAGARPSKGGDGLQGV